jgi:HD-GYP domain-containing protein (c-di-GMP phosphodiesterase class II)
MTEDRVYRKALTLEDAIREIDRCAGTQFDPACAGALLDVVRASRSARPARDALVRIARYPQ